MNQHEIYKMCVQHEKATAVWHDTIIKTVLGEINIKGYIEPRCYVMYYNFLLSDYQTQIIEMDKESMLNAEANQKIHNTLQNIDAGLPFPCVAMMFASEGTVPIVGEKDKMPFLLITFETRTKGWKHLYRMKKESLVVPGGTTKIIVREIEYDKEGSEAHDSAAIEKYAHILRPNIYNPSESIYN